jgi:RNA recognition motif-containing protein
MGQKLFVGRLPFDFTDEKLRALFAPSGTVLSATMVPDPKNGRSRGFGFVTLSTKQETDAAILKLNGQRIGEKEIWVTEAKEQVPKAPGPSAPSRFPKRRPNRFGPRP